MRFLGRSASDRAVLLFGCLLIALMIVLAVVASAWLRSRAEQDLRDQLQSTSLAMAGYTSQTMTSANLVLERVVGRVVRLEAGSAAELRAKAATEEMHRFLRDRSESSPQVQVITIVGSDGNVIALSRTFPAPPINLSDREHFIAHKMQREPGPWISRPVVGRGTGRWTFYISRRLENKNGEFLGAVIVGLSCEYLSEVYDSIAKGFNGEVTLYRQDLVQMAMSPPDDTRMGKMITDWPFPAMTNAGGPDWRVQMRHGGTVDQQGVNETRMIVSRRVPGYPLFLGVGIPESTLYSRWYPVVTQLVVALAIAIAAVVLATVALRRLVQRLERDRMDAVEASRKAEFANTTKTDFLATMSHEIRTPLTGILGYSELLLDSKLNEAQRDCAGMVHKASQSLLDIINELLDFAKIESGHLELRSLPFDPMQLAREVGALFAPAAKKKSLAIDVVCEPGLPAMVIGEPVRLRQVLCNLVNNAVKFTDRGSVTLQVGVSDVPAPVDRVYLCFSVTDTGVGIDSAAMPRLFEPFQQLDRPNEWQQGGTGLGLAISKRLVHLMGGRIDVASTPGQGTRFEVSLSLELARQETVAMAQAAAAAGALPRARPRRRFG